MSLTKAKNLTERAVRQKRVGNYDAAVVFYKKAIDADPTYYHAYYSLAKTYYLLGDSRQSALNYLRAGHISVYRSLNTRDAADSVFQLAASAMFGQYPKKMLDRLDLVHESCRYILMDPNLIKHMGHSVYDFSAGRINDISPEDQEIAKHIEKYRFALGGTKLHMDGRFDLSFYIPIGLPYFVRYLRWDLADLLLRPQVVYPDDLDIVSNNISE